MRRFRKYLAFLAAAGLFVALFFVCSLLNNQCTEPDPVIKPPQVPDTVLHDHAFDLDTVELEARRVPHQVELYRKNTKVARQVRDADTNIAEVELQTFEEDSATVKISIVDSVGVVQTRTYAFTPSEPFKLKSDYRGGVQAEYLTDKERRKRKRRQRWKKVGIALGVTAVFVGGIFTGIKVSQ